MPQRGDPKFVRLPERLVTGCLGDVEGSGWFIGGMDVKPFPDDDDPQAQSFVRGHFRQGNLEEATKNEHEIVSDSSDTMKKMHLNQLNEHDQHDRAGHQEAQLLTLARRTNEKLARLRRSGESDEEETEEEAEDVPRTGSVGGRESASEVQTVGKARQQARQS